MSEPKINVYSYRIIAGISGKFFVDKLKELRKILGFDHNFSIMLGKILNPLSEQKKHPESRSPCCAFQDMAEKYVFYFQMLTNGRKRTEGIGVSDISVIDRKGTNN